jgi:ribosomal protein L15E
MHHVLRLRLSERERSQAALTPLALQSSYPSKGRRRPQNVVVSRAARIECIARAAEVREGTRCRNAVVLHPL